jgi:hypothetical protein
LDSADVLKAAPKEFKRQLGAQKQAHLEAERNMLVDEHNSALGEAERRIRDQHDLIDLHQYQLNKLKEAAKASIEREKAAAQEASKLESSLRKRRGVTGRKVGRQISDGEGAEAGTLQREMSLPPKIYTYTGPAKVASGLGYLRALKFLVPLNFFKERSPF